MADTKVYTTDPRVCVQDLASYNAGRLIFEWVDATDVGAIEACWERVKERAVQAAKEAGEYPVYFGEPEERMLADWEGFPEGTVGEWSSSDFVAALAAALDAHGEAFAAYLSLGRETIGEVNDVERAEEAFEEAFCGEHDSLKDYAYEYVEEVGIGGIAAGPVYEIAGSYGGGEKINVIEQLESYIDFDSVASELRMEGYSEVTVEPSYKTYIFRP